jgi:hypothetical protein
MRFQFIAPLLGALLATAGSLLVGSLHAHTPPAQQGPARDLSCADADQLPLRKAAILAELKAGRREPWEGEFFATTGFWGLSQGWLIARKAGYVSTTRLRDLGTVDATGDRVTLISDSPIKPASGKLTEYIVVPWGERAYLVKPELLLSFCNDVNAGRMQSPGTTMGLYLLRLEDWEKKVSGLPDVPKEYRQYLLDKPLAGTIVAVNGLKEDVAIFGDRFLRGGLSVTVDIGKRVGVRTGMEFFPEQESDRYESGVSRIVVVSMTAERAELLVVCEEPEKARKTFKPGLRLTTSDPLHRKK